MSRNNQTPNTPNTPISFKTVPGRNRTQKWNKAPAYNYDGDDWGGYDPYDEYGGGEQEVPPPMPAPAPAQHAASQLPSQQPISRGRNNSFDRGDETRQFSSSTAASAFPAYEERRPSRGPAPSSAASGGRGSNDMPRSGSRPRDFTNPDQAPPPLVTRASPAPIEWFPPRKSSLKGGTYETAAAAAEARAIAASVAQSSSPPTDKPLPFIRPSDIYRRIPEEMRRQSEESSRPSMDSLQREMSPIQSTLTPVAEARESRLFMDADIPNVQEKSGNVGAQAAQLPNASTGPQQSERGVSPTLPQVQRFSGFGDDFLGGANTSRGRPDLAAEILAERQHDVPVNAISTGNATELQHQNSQGFRSAVHQAFDRTDDATISRDSSQSGPAGSGVSRSDTTSTAGISPIMSRVPSGTTAQARQQQLEQQVPSIAEEPSITPTGSRPASGAHAAHRIPRKPSPGHSRNVSGETATPADFEPGYRRSLDPPSTGTSPARTPGLETTSKRLSSPMSAVTITEPDAPDVVDQGAEVVEPELHPVETPASEISGLGDMEAPTKPLPIPGRGRSGTDYSVREADIADSVNSSPDKGISSPSIAQAQRNSQKEFLEQHATPTTEVAGLGLRDGTRSQTGTPAYGSRAGSPAKGRAREIADKYNEIHNASRRNSATSMHSSKSSWSQFDKPGLSRQGTAESQTGNEIAASSGLGVSRPEIGREESFQPDIPGGWVSSAPTPALESPPVEPSRSLVRDALPQPETPIDLTPTTRKYQLQAEPVTPGVTDTSKSAFESAKTVGEKLGASLLSTVGIGHQTRDFASAQPAAPVDQPEMHPRAPTGDLSLQPPLMRLQSDSTDAATSVASSVAPTPPAKDTPKDGMLGVSGGSGGYFNAVAPLRIRSREASPEHTQTTSQAPVLPALSTSRHASDMDSDRLRKEIVRSLDPGAQHVTPRASMDDVERTQDALDAPDNERRVEQGPASAPAAEGVSTKPGLLNTRFSWENTPPAGASVKEATPVPEPGSPEIKPEMAYERPRSSVLHVVNAAVSPISPDVPSAAQTTLSPIGASTGLSSAITPITKSQEHLLPESSLQAGSPSQDLRDIAPSPISENAESVSTRLPSYYLADPEPELPEAPEKDQTNSSSMSHPSSPVLAKANAPIPPFRNILQLKTSVERIERYNDTRQTFADMNTGLSDWLAKMLEYHPEHAGLSVSSTGGFKPPALQTQTSNFKRGHRASPSIAKFTDQFRSGSGQRTASVGDPEGDLSPRPTTGGANADGPRMDMNQMQQQMQQRGKEFMKNASVLSGKASSGAKGLFAKGKSRFAGGSVRGKPNSNYEAPATSSSSNAADCSADERKNKAVTRPVAASPLVIATSAEPVVTQPQPQQTVNDFKAAGDKLNIQLPRSDVRTPITAIPVNTANEKCIQSPRSDVPTPITAIPVNASAPAANDKSVQSPRNDVPEPVTAILLNASSAITASAANDTRVQSLPIGIPATPPIVPVNPPEGQPDPPPSTIVATPRRESLTGSPFRRPRSQTPSSSPTSSRPLSQVFERLKDKTRNVSRSSTTSEKRKVESRPTSFVLTNPDLVSDETVSDEMGEFKIKGVRSTQRGVESWEGERPPMPQRESESPRPPHLRSNTAPTRRTMSMAMPVRTEAWNEPDVELPPKTPERNAAMGRIGILPSPAPTLLTFEDARRASQEVAKRRSSNAKAEMVGWREVGWREELGTVPSAESEEEEEVGEKDETEVVEKGNGIRRESGEIINPSKPADDMPKVIRRGSDLATLPSLQASRPPTSATQKEKMQTAWLKEEDEDATPPEQDRPQGRYFIANAVPRDQQVSNETSPVSEAAQPPQQHKRRISDFALLPSQKHSPLNVGRPDSQVLVPLRMPSDDIMGETSPTTIKQKSLTFGSNKATPTTAPAKAGNELYDSTPIATKAPSEPFKRVGSTGHENDIGQMEREIARAAATVDVSRPTTSEQFEDSRSEVSAEEGVAEEVTRSKSNLTLSRHSSVSSLGDPEKDMLASGTAEPTLMSDEARQLLMSAQAIPAGPSQEEVNRQAEQETQEQRFANRLYARTQERPLSYVPEPRDRQGLIREQIATGAQEHPIPVVDLGGMSGPPTGTPPFQQHPMFRPQGVQPTEYEQLRQSVGGTHTPQSSVEEKKKSRFFRSRNNIVEAASPMAFAAEQPTEYEQLRQSTVGGRSSVDLGEEKRKSGFFRSRKDTVEAAVPPMPFAAPSQIDDRHGLEDLHDFGPAERMASPPAQGQSGTEQKQARRGSGIWNAFGRRASRASARPGSSRDSSLAPLDSRNERPVSRRLDNVKEDLSKPKTLRKPQRTTSDAVELEPKKKRFSKLGSLFGRSNTTASSENAPSSRDSPRPSRDSPKPNRLSKKNQDGSVRRSETVQEPRAMGYGTMPGNVNGYAAYERIKQRYDVPAFQENQNQARRPPTAPEAQPPVDGWYGPSSRETVEPTTTSAPLPEFRRLHSSGKRQSRAPEQSRVPEAFRPVPASFDQPVEPVGPPPGHEPPFRVMSPEQMHYAQGGRPVAIRVPTGSPNAERNRQMSYGSDVSQLSRQVSAQEVSVSPVQANAYPPPRQRVGSIGEGVAAPPGGYQAPLGSPRPQQYANGPPPRGPPSQGRPPSQGPCPRQGQRHASVGNAGPPRPIPWEDQQPVRQTQPGPYPPPPKSFAAPERQMSYESPARGLQYPPQPGQHIYYQQQRPLPQQNRYYAQQGPTAPQRTPSGPGANDPFASQQRRPSSGYRHQRRPSGYTGRRDDPTAGEEDLIMRGASYPGQEWAPSGLSRNDWD